jgi:hypothetical protein
VRILFLSCKLLWSLDHQQPSSCGVIYSYSSPTSSWLKLPGPLYFTHEFLSSLQAIFSYDRCLPIKVETWDKVCRIYTCLFVLLNFFIAIVANEYGSCVSVVALMQPRFIIKFCNLKSLIGFAQTDRRSTVPWQFSPGPFCTRRASSGDPLLWAGNKNRNERQTNPKRNQHTVVHSRV